MSQVLLGNCLDVLKTLPDNSVDSVCCDPPYELGFMGKSWDNTGIANNKEMWAECLRVLKPGGHLLAFSGTRTYHRMAVAIEDAGFEVRDMIEWCYGSGFPKSLNIGVAVNKLETKEWSAIGKALDNINQESIIEVWKTNSNNVKIVETQLLKLKEKAGCNTPSENFAQENVVENTNQIKLNLNVNTAEKHFIVLQAINTEVNTALQNVEKIITEIKELQNLATIAENSQQKDPAMRSTNIFTAQCDVKEWLNENTMVNHKVDEALKTLRGNKKYSNEEITSVLCAGLTDILKLTILSQSNTFQNLDTKSQTDFLSATNVIITEYTAENLISNTVAILKSKAVDKLQGNERKIVGKKILGGIKRARPDNADGFSNPYTSGQTIGDKTKGNSPWEGWGTALKPAHEPIVWATKSLTNKNQFAIMEDINSNLISTIWQSLENLQKQDTFKLQETVLIHLNTALLWQNILVELLKNESKFTTSTASKMITELKILNSLLLKNTQDDTDGKSQTYQNGTQESQANGLDLLVGIVESCLAGEKKSIANIQTLIVQGLATYKQNRTGMTVKNAEQDLLPIILNANSVLISVLTDIITELSQNELSTFVSFAEKSLKQYLAEPQSIADENVWQEHIQKALPSHSPICMARKPLAEKTVAENCLKYGTGGINIDESRVGTEQMGGGTMPDLRDVGAMSKEAIGIYKLSFGQNPRPALRKEQPTYTGRFPANLIHDNSEEVRECFPDSKAGGAIKEHKRDTSNINFASHHQEWEGFNDSGNASRFFKGIPQVVDLHDFSIYNRSILTKIKQLCGQHLTKKKTDITLDGVIQEVEKFIQDAELLMSGNSTTIEKFLTDIVSITKTLIAQMIELKTLNVLPNWLITKFTEENEQTIKLLKELNTEDVKSAKSIFLLQTFISEVLESIRAIAEIVAEQDSNNGDYKSLIYKAKASKSERNMGCEGLEEKNVLGYEIDPEHPYRSGKMNNSNIHQLTMAMTGKPPKPQKNNHPTVKPIALMEYLIKMVTPNGGIVLDPFAGSGSTLVAAKELGYDFIGIEMTEEYIPIIEARLKAVNIQKTLI